MSLLDARRLLAAAISLGSVFALASTAIARSPDDAAYLAFLAKLQSAAAVEEAKAAGRPYALLFHSIMQEPGRDGASPDTAFRGISIGERYAVLNHLQLRSRTKSLESGTGGAVADCHQAEGKDGEPPRRICFDVSVPMAALSRTLGSGKPKP